MFILALALVPGIAAAQKRAAPAPDAQQMIGVQVALDRAGFSPGEIDGRGGPKTKLALSQFQKSAGLPATGVVNEETIAALSAPAEPVVTYTIAPEDVAGPFIGSMPGDMMESATLPALGYTSALEALAEKFHASPALLQTLNPGAAWSAGDAIKVPAVEPFEPQSSAEKATAGAETSGDVEARVAVARSADLRREQIAPRPRCRWKSVDVRAHHHRQQQRSASGRRLEGDRRFVESDFQLQP